MLSPHHQGRRPALIPPDLHLSAEDEESIILRIGNLQLASFGTRPTHTHEHSTTTQFPTEKILDHTFAPRPNLFVVDRGTKRKASTTAEQYRELDCTIEANSNQQNECLAIIHACPKMAPGHRKLVGGNAHRNDYRTVREHQRQYSVSKSKDALSPKTQREPSTEQQATCPAKL